MKITKKIIMAMIAILPFIAILAFVLSNIGADTGTQYMPMGAVDIVDTADGLTIVTEADTWADRILTPIFGNAPLQGVFDAFARMMLFLQDNIGLPISLPVIGSFVMLTYLAWIELCNMLLSLILFVPRKCTELFRG